MSPLNAAICTTISYILELNVVEKICHESKYLQAVDQSNYYYSNLVLWILNLYNKYNQH
jgi:hypothetical protein